MNFDFSSQHDELIVNEESILLWKIEISISYALMHFEASEGVEQEKNVSSAFNQTKKAFLNMKCIKIRTLNTDKCERKRVESFQTYPF